MLEFVANNIILFAALVVIIFLIVSFELRNIYGKVKKLTIDDLTRLLNQSKVILLDLRTEDEYALGHIISAINIKHEELQTLDMKKDSTLVAYSTSESEGLKAANMLSKMKDTEVYYLEGGINSWKENNMPLTGEN